MAYLAVKENGDECVFEAMPTRFMGMYKSWSAQKDTKYAFLEDGTIKIILGRKLTWTDEPVEVEAKFNLNY
jgi:hypothetical protein